MTRWMHPPELARTPERDQFDPVIDGKRYGLPRELLLAIWERVCRDATDRAGRLDADPMQRRFHELAAWIAAHDGRLHSDVGRLTYVQTDTIGVPRGALAVDELAPRAPGRTTLVDAETRPRTMSGWLPPHPLLPMDVAKPLAPGRQTLVGHVPSPRLGFEDYRVRGLQGVLQRLGPEHSLRAELIAAAASTDRSTAGRATLWREPLPVTATPEGHALWRVAERHAAMLYRRAVHDGVVEEHDPAIESALHQRGTGQSLPAELRRDMERALGVSLARVRIHTDMVAAHAARVLGAEAFTVGEDIFFADGAFAPEADRGIKLLAHELAHVIQGWQGRAAVGQQRSRVSDPRDPLEHEADAIAERVDQRLAGEKASLHPHVAATGQPDRGLRVAGPIQAAGLENSPEAAAHLPAHGDGAKLPEDVRRKMEAVFGVDFSSVRIHEGAYVEAVGALAYTQGTHIHFAPGQYQPTSQRGQELLGHELAHVVQQSQARVRTTIHAGGVEINDDASLEREADEMGARAAQAEVGREPLRRPAGGWLDDAASQQNHQEPPWSGAGAMDLASALDHPSRGHATRSANAASPRAGVIQRQHVRLPSGRYVGDLPGSTTNVREDVLRVMDKLHEMWSLSNPDYMAEYPVVGGQPVQSHIPAAMIPRTIAALQANEQPTLAPGPAQQILGITISMPVGRGQPNNQVDIYRLQDALHSLWHISNSDYATERAAVNAGPDPVPEGIIPRTIDGIAQMKVAYVSGRWRGTGGLLAGTAPVSASQQGRIRPNLTPGVPPGTTFRDLDGGRSYRDHLWEMLELLRAQWYTESRDLLAATPAPMSRFEEIAAEAKQQVDADFGQYVTGPALTAAAGNLVDLSTFPPSAPDLIEYLINEDDHSQPIRTRHGADNARSARPAYTVPAAGVTTVAQVAAANHTTPQAIASANGLTATSTVSPGQILNLPFEPDIVAQVITDYCSDPTRQSQYEVIDRAWPGAEIGGRVGIQRAVGSAEGPRRRAFWENFQTVIHEYLHSITHPNYTRVAESMGQVQKGVLIEGGTSLFTDHVWQRLNPTVIRSNAALRQHVEGRAHTYQAGVIPPISHYGTIAQARNIEGIVGPANMRAAYFLGNTELLGFTGPGTYTVPPHGVTTVADVAYMTGLSAEDIAALNSLRPSSNVTPGQSLRLR
ncbi:MAG TPA: DUF4157 domain-containing protein [Kofleriaceae bacterium]